MALLDHFHPPLQGRRHWHSFDNGWAYNLSEDLNLKLPKGYFTVHRHAFVSKCETLLRQGIGLVIVDVVTNRVANLHDELMCMIDTGEPMWGTLLYSTAYRPVDHDGESALDIWQHELHLGEQLPNMPLWLPGGLYLPVDLNASYERTCRAHRLDEL
jgi:hypothetical protein